MVSANRVIFHGCAQLLAINFLSTYPEMLTYIYNPGDVLGPKGVVRKLRVT
jgi:hypothetical protein